MGPIRTPVKRRCRRALSSELAGGWRLVRTHNPNGGADAISIMHTADTSRSDLDLAGLMIRCSETSAEVVIVLLPALPFRARPHVTFGKPGNETQFEATVAPPGTAVLLPRDATTLVSGPWQALEDLFIRIMMANPQFAALLSSQACKRLSRNCKRVVARIDCLRV